MNTDVYLYHALKEPTMDWTLYVCDNAENCSGSEECKAPKLREYISEGMFLSGGTWCPIAKRAVQAHEYKPQTEGE